MAFEERMLELNPSTHIKTTAENQAFYDEIVNEKHYFATKHQMYTCAIMVAILENAQPDYSSKTKDICLVGNVDKTNIAIAKGLVVHICDDVTNGTELLSKMNAYADAGIELLKKNYSNNDGQLFLEQYMDK